MSHPGISYRCEGDVAHVALDDGKANALSLEAVAELRACLERAEKEAQAVLLSGRAGRFSGGFDLKTMGGGDGAAVRELVGAGAELMLAMYGSPLPIVTACTGHAVAAGALLLASDLRIGGEGEYRIGLPEVAIGMTLPVFGVELARARLSKRHFDRAVVHGETYLPADAVDAGFLDEVVPAEQLAGRAAEEAARLGALARGAVRGTKQRAHGALIEQLRAGLDADLRAITPD